MLEYRRACGNKDVIGWKTAQGVFDWWMENERRRNMLYSTNFEELKSQLFVSACNAEWNKEMLRHVPHEVHGDFAMVFRIFIQETAWPERGILLNNSVFGKLGISMETLKKCAFENMKRILPPVFMGLDSVINILQGGDEQTKDDMELPQIWETEIENNSGCVLTNSQNLYGAGYVFDTETMERITEVLQDNLIVLPSSTHEILVMRESMIENPEELKEMVYEINRNAVKKTDWLSDEIYRYDREAHHLNRIEDFGQEQGLSPGMG